MIKKLLRKFLFPNTYNSDAFVKYLKKNGVIVGKGCVFYSPNNTFIDTQRPHSLSIGDYVRITAGVTILCHDYSRSVLCNIRNYGNVGEYRSTSIGSNVFIGVNATILMGASIGNNSIVGAGAVVNGFFPDNSVIAGNPAKIICSIDEFYNKRKSREVDEAKQFVFDWRKHYSRNPTIDEMTNTFSWLYLKRDRDEIKRHENLFSLSGIDRELFIETFLKSEPIYDSFEDFLRDCGDDI